MHLTQQQIAVAVAILFEVLRVRTMRLGHVLQLSSYRKYQAGLAIWWGAPWSWQVVERSWNWKPIPRSEFTELGLWYRRRAFIAGIVFATWGVRSHHCERSGIVMVRSALDANDIAPEPANAADFRSGARADNPTRGVRRAKRAASCMMRIRRPKSIEDGAQRP
jgi:hypothetical protein